MAKRMEKDLGFWVNALPDPISNSPYCLSCNWENLVLDQFIRPKFKIFFILITCLLDIVLILKGEILSWSLMGVLEGLSLCYCPARFSKKINMQD